MSAYRQFVALGWGISLPLIAFTDVLRSPRLLLLALVPILFMAILFVTAWVVAWWFLGDLATFLGSFLNFLPLSFLGDHFGFAFKALGYVALMLTVGLALTFIIYIAAVLIMSPWLSLLAQHILSANGVEWERRQSWAEGVMFAMRMTWVSMLRTLLFMPLVLLLGIAGFLMPHLGWLWLWCAGLIFALDLTDFPAELLNHGFRQRIRTYISAWPSYLGLGLSLAVIQLVPGLPILLLPIIVIAVSRIQARTQTAGAGTAC